MNKSLLSLAIMLTFSSSVYAIKPLELKPTPGAPQEHVDTKDISYVMGFSMGSNLKKQKIDFNQEAFTNGLTEGLEGKPGKYTEAQMRERMIAFERQIITQRAARMQEDAEKNKKAGTAFLEENKKKPGVVTLANGIQYKIVTEGKGAKPSAASTVTVDYTGKLLSGEVFDSTKQHGQPATFQLSNVIKGWQDVLPLMKEGSTWEVYIPADLAYGANGSQNIGPNETLIFEIHLVSVKASESKAESKTQKSED